MKIIKDLGMIFINENSKKKKHYVICECPFCQKEFKARTDCIKNGNTKSCGCYNKKIAIQTHTKHGFTNHKLYIVYNNMMRRCYDKKLPAYKDYGAKGITVCKEWHNVANFINDMIPTYQNGLSIDKDYLCKQKGIYPHIYSKDTCIWTSKTIQSRATRKIYSHNTSGYRGVYKYKNNKFQSCIVVNNKRVHLGYFDIAINAAKAYDQYVIDNNLEHTINGVQYE